MNTARKIALLIAILSLAACAGGKKVEDELNRLANSGMVPIVTTNNDVGSVVIDVGAGSDLVIAGDDTASALVVSQPEDLVPQNSTHDEGLGTGSASSSVATVSGDHLVVIGTEDSIPPFWIGDVSPGTCKLAAQAKATLLKSNDGREWVKVTGDSGLLGQVASFRYAVVRNGNPVEFDCAEYQAGANCSELLNVLAFDVADSRSIAPALDGGLTFGNRLELQPGDELRIWAQYRAGSSCNPVTDPGPGDGVAW
ncbi:MAG: hypothetical protein V1495_08725 [Pseudomonadota bacterium]